MIIYVKNLILRIFLSSTIIVLLLFVWEFILSKTDNAWYKENDVINNMNYEKLENNTWFESSTWLHKDDVILPKTDGVKRILVVGDSYIWGDGYSNANHIWWQQFKHLLKENGYNNVEVYAAGLSGYNTYQELEFILKKEEIIKSIDPDFIVIGYVSNDMDSTDLYGNQLVKVLISDNIFNGIDNIITNNFEKKYPYLAKKISILLSKKFYNNSKFNEIFGLNWENWQQTISSGEWLAKYENNVLEPLNNYIKNDINVPYIIYMTNISDCISFSNVSKSFEKYGIKYYSFPNLIKELNIDILQDDNYRKINPVNWHPSVYDGQLFAKGLLQVLEEDYPDILGEKSGTYEPTLNINDWMPYSLNPQKIKDNIYTIMYPSQNSENSFLYLPVNKNYVKLNLEDPLNIKNIEITGDNIEEIEIFINCIDKELGFDNQEMYSLGIKKDKFNWNNIDIENITSINISAKIKNGKSSELTIKID